MNGIQQIIGNFQTFARHCICIEGKGPGEVLWGSAIADKPPNTENWEFNDIQDFLWRLIQWLMQEYGLVRLIIIKGRQQGVSTFIEMLFLWLALFVANTKVCIIS